MNNNEIYNEDQERGIKWNKLLTGISIINTLVIFQHFITRYKKLNNEDLILNILVIIYVLVCALRSIWPRVDGSGLCFYDNFISSPFFGRCCATVAEISFGLFLVNVTKIIFRYIGPFSVKNILSILNNSLVYIITIAQFFCWMGIISKDANYNAIEESLWTIFGSSKFIIYLILLLNINQLKQTKYVKSIKRILPYILIFSFSYIFFMVNIDVPMYLKRAKVNKKNNIKYNDFVDGVNTLTKCQKITKSYQDWKEDIPWLSLYFSLSVWASIIILKWIEKFKIL